MGNGKLFFSSKIERSSMLIWQMLFNIFHRNSIAINTHLLTENNLSCECNLWCNLSDFVVQLMDYGVLSYRINSGDNSLGNFAIKLIYVFCDSEFISLLPFVSVCSLSMTLLVLLKVMDNSWWHEIGCA